MCSSTLLELIGGMRSSMLAKTLILNLSIVIGSAAGGSRIIPVGESTTTGIPFVPSKATAIDQDVEAIKWF